MDVGGWGAVGAGDAAAMAETLTRPGRERGERLRRHLAASAVYEAVRGRLGNEDKLREDLPEGVHAEVDLDDDVVMRAGDVWMHASLTFRDGASEVVFRMARGREATGSCDGVVRARAGEAGRVVQVEAAAGGARRVGEERALSGDVDVGAAVWAILLEEVFLRYCGSAPEEAARGAPPRGATVRGARSGVGVDATAGTGGEGPDAAGEGIALYEVGDVADAQRGGAGGKPEEGGWGEAERLRGALVAKGREGAMRRLAVADAAMVARLRALGAQAPHLVELTEVIGRQMLLSMRTGTPLRMRPILLVGAPGTSKSYYMRRVGELMGIPFRRASMNSTSLGESFSGMHPSYKASGQGLVATTLLREAVANPLFLVDEFDKTEGPGGGDLLRSFYTLLEPESASAFVDDFLGFPIDASHVMWIMTANEERAIPPVLLSRMRVVRVPEIGAEAMVAILASIHAEANRQHRGWFDPTLDPRVVAALVGTSPRRAKMALQEGMARAAADGRRTLRVADLGEPEVAGRGAIGFVQGQAGRSGVG